MNASAGSELPPPAGLPPPRPGRLPPPHRARDLESVPSPPAAETKEPSKPPRAVLSDLDALRAEIAQLIAFSSAAMQTAREAYGEAQEQAVREQLARMPLDALKEASEGRLRLGALQDAGFRSIAHVQSWSSAQLETLDGVGPKTAVQVVAAANHVEAALRDVTRVRFDVDARHPEQTKLLHALQALDRIRRHVDPLQERLDEVVTAVDADIGSARLEARPIRRSFSSARRKANAQEALDRLRVLLDDPRTTTVRTEVAEVRAELARPAERQANIWDDYLAHSVAYNGLLVEVGGLDAEAGAAQGFLPDEIVERIQAFELDATLLDVSLRGYQSFGAKFTLVQGRTILGDEMGLGKTIEALAAMCHLRSNGATHFLVVCPFSVLANWEHEIRRHTRLERPWRLHGLERERRLDRWARTGGVAVTTFDTLRVLSMPDVDIAATVIDEAHYVKNPDALRTIAARSWLAKSTHILLMSGTPMENRVTEFKTLVHHIRPDVAATIRETDGIAGADAFRKSVAPVYLRRNQADVLNELPPKIETPEWLTLEGAAAQTYWRAVADRNFMAMRRAAFLTPRPEDSPKLTRLLDIVGEAADNERKVVVFSYFRDVIDIVHRALGDLAAGPLTGSVSGPERQIMIDRFSSQREPAVLVSQIEAGGVGLNIQAASVVILTEPQWKPSTEDQAIARCHRMGQVRPVEVHRLLTEDSVDERMLRLLADKSVLFAEYVRASAMKDASPAAVDVTDDVSTVRVASQAERERRIIELERARLGMTA